MIFMFRNNTFPRALEKMKKLILPSGKFIEGTCFQYKVFKHVPQIRTEHFEIHNECAFSLAF